MTARRAEGMMETCSTCKYFMPLSPGYAAICGEKWRDLPWNAAVPLTTANDSCEKHESKFEGAAEMNVFLVQFLIFAGLFAYSVMTAATTPGMWFVAILCLFGMALAGKYGIKAINE